MGRCGGRFGRLSDAAKPATLSESPDVLAQLWSGSGSGRCVGQSGDPLACTDQQVIGRVSSRQADDQFPGMSDHSSSKIDDSEAYSLQTPAHPLSSQHQPLHHRVQIERQHHDGPPRGIRPEPARWQPPARKVILQNSMHLLALPTPLSDDTVHAIGHHRPLPPPL